MDGLRQALMDELVASPVSEGFDSKRSTLSVGAPPSLTLPFPLFSIAVLWFSYLRSIESQDV
ncbi:hypothetical protein CWC33_10180 [Idiomarina sp. X4]|nr:hypothetical protein CWC33_10180 [Idiomarina sp. X4]